VREILSHKKVDVAAWVEIITTAHSLGVPTTSTVMYGHVETPRHVVNHLDLLRTIQKQTHGFHRVRAAALHPSEYRAFPQRLVSPTERGALRFPDVRVLAPVLRGQIDNIQTRG